jgi:Zn finger protein HypA/HybF involved in hydrogenase expression
MPTFECRKCLPTNVPDDWTIEMKAEIASLIRNTSPISAIQYFQPVGMNLTNAKGISLHVTRKKGLCHHCKTELVEYEGNCPKCKRLNLDW